MKNFIFAIILFLIPCSMLFPQDFSMEYHLNNGKIVIGIYVSDSRDSVCIRLFNDSIKYFNWDDVKTYYYVEFSHAMKPLRDTVYKLTDTSDADYTGLIMKDTINYIIFKTGFNDFRIFRKAAILKMEPVPVEIRDNWIWNKESCTDRLLYSHTGKISPAGTCDLSINELFLFFFLGYSITDWLQFSIETTLDAQPIWLQLRTGKQIFKNFYTSIGISR